MNNPTSLSTNISPVDILWAFYKSQKQSVRNAFVKRLVAERKAKEVEQMNAYEHNLTKSEKLSAYKLAKAVKKGIKDVDDSKDGLKKNVRKAEEFLVELQNSDI